MKEPKFKEGDILVNSKGWKRLIKKVMYDYLDVPDKFGYWYSTERMDDNCRTIPGEFETNMFAFRMCSQEHMLAKGYRLEIQTV